MNSSKTSTTSRTNLGKWISLFIRGWAIFILFSSPIQLIISIGSTNWHTADGTDIPYTEFPIATLSLMVGLWLVRTCLLVWSLWSMHNVYSYAIRHEFFTTSMYHRLRKASIRLFIVGFIDIFYFLVCYISLAMFDERVVFNPNIGIFLTVLIGPDKLFLAGLVFTGAKIVKRGIELENEAKLTV